MYAPNCSGSCGVVKGADGEGLDAASEGKSCFRLLLLDFWGLPAEAVLLERWMKLFAIGVVV